MIGSTTGIGAPPNPIPAPPVDTLPGPTPLEDTTPSFNDGLTGVPSIGGATTASVGSTLGGGIGGISGSG